MDALSFSLCFDTTSMAHRDAVRVRAASTPSPQNQGLHKYRASDVSGFVQWTARTAGLPTETPSMKSQVEQDEHSARHAILGWEGIMEAQFVGAI
ncbi:hypothetical protein [Tabrizicola flagellatus]|uniref:hypothetical protein n=1 Tax=Tabrizicola flagellatus TaxID=2593021 RepID=UPI0011F1BD77|nr:hypothetical protein [Tabrizicola flagellatus]